MTKKNSEVTVAVSSIQIGAELQEIKERLSTIESIMVFSSGTKIEEMVKAGIKSTKYSREILKACIEPRDREYLQKILGLNNNQALDPHLRKLRDEHGLLEQLSIEGKMHYILSRIIRKLPPRSLVRLLELNQNE